MLVVNEEARTDATGAFRRAMLAHDHINWISPYPFLKFLCIFNEGDAATRAFAGATSSHKTSVVVD